MAQKLEGTLKGHRHQTEETPNGQIWDNLSKKMKVTN